MTWIDDEGSVEDSAFVEGLEIQHGEISYRISCGSRDEFINSNPFIALPASRTSISVVMVTKDDDVKIQLPTSHPFSKRYNRMGLPPKIITVACYRKQLRSGETKRVWYGLIEGCSIDENHIASFTIPSMTKSSLRTRLPVITVGRACPYVLYGAGCNVPRIFPNVVRTALTHVDGPTVTVGGIGGNPTGWADGGEIVHLRSGERMTIVQQIGNVIKIQLPIQEMQTLDEVDVFRGCGHDIRACRDDFANLDNYGGTPLLPSGDVFLPNGYGIYQSDG